MTAAHASPAEDLTDLDDLADIDQRELDQLRLDVKLTGGVEFQVTTTNVDRVRWDLHRSKAKWPGPDEAPFLFLTFLAHNAARREGKHEGTFDAFAAECELVRAVKRDELEDTAHPSRPGHEPG